MKQKMFCNCKRTSPQSDCITNSIKAKIKIALIKSGITQKQLAEELGVSHGHMSSVISGKVKSARVRDYILNRLGLANGRRRKA